MHDIFFMRFTYDAAIKSTEDLKQKPPMSNYSYTVHIVPITLMSHDAPFQRQNERKVFHEPVSRIASTKEKKKKKREMEKFEGRGKKSAEEKRITQ